MGLVCGWGSGYQYSRGDIICVIGAVSGERTHYGECEGVVFEERIKPTPQ